MNDADKIREFAISRFIDPARNNGWSSVSIAARDISDSLGLVGRYPNVCQALAGNKFKEMACVELSDVIGKCPSSTTIFVYKL